MRIDRTVIASALSARVLRQPPKVRLRRGVAAAARPPAHLSEERVRDMQEALLTWVYIVDHFRPPARDGRPPTKFDVRLDANARRALAMFILNEIESWGDA